MYWNGNKILKMMFIDIIFINYYYYYKTCNISWE